jgi:ABC-type Fe3+/spermidine/putrescine transport system ATPase subunit
MSDRVVVMNFGEIQQVGTPEEVYRHPANRFVAEFVGRVNLIDGVATGNVVAVDGSTHRLTLSGVEVSGPVTLALRPEAVTLVAADDTSVNGTNTWDASVHTVAFLGDHYEYEVNAGPVALMVQSSRKVEGDRVRVHIPPDACAVVA